MTYTCLSARVPEEKLVKWREEAEEKWAQSFSFRWAHDESGKANRSKSRQTVDSSTGDSHMKALLRGQFYGTTARRKGRNPWNIITRNIKRAGIKGGKPEAGAYGYDSSPARNTQNPVGNTSPKRSSISSEPVEVIKAMIRNHKTRPDYSATERLSVGEVIKMSDEKFFALDPLKPTTDPNPPMSALRLVVEQEKKKRFEVPGGIRRGGYTAPGPSVHTASNRTSAKAVAAPICNPGATIGTQTEQVNSGKQSQVTSVVNCSQARQGRLETSEKRPSAPASEVKSAVRPAPPDASAKPAHPSPHSVSLKEKDTSKGHKGDMEKILTALEDAAYGRGGDRERIVIASHTTKGKLNVAHRCVPVSIDQRSPIYYAAS